MRVLVIEDSKPVTDAIEAICKYENIDYDIANDGVIGLNYALQPIYDVIILDIMLPGKSGLEILKELRSRNITTPVLVLTAKGEANDKLQSFNLGADDYLVKPFRTSELFARINALARRVENETSVRSIEFEDIVFMPNRFSFFIDGEEKKLSQKQSMIFEMLLRSPGKVFSRDEILDRVWGPDRNLKDNNVEAAIYKIRKQLKGSRVQIETVRNTGYSVRSR